MEMIAIETNAMKTKSLNVLVVEAAVLFLKIDDVESNEDFEDSPTSNNWNADEMIRKHDLRPTVNETIVLHVVLK